MVYLDRLKLITTIFAWFFFTFISSSYSKLWLDFNSNRPSLSNAVFLSFMNLFIGTIGSLIQWGNSDANNKKMENLSFYREEKTKEKTSMKKERRMLVISVLFLMGTLSTNISMTRMNVSFVQLVKGILPLFVLVWSHFGIFGSKLPDLSHMQFASVMLTIMGVVLASKAESSFSWIGMLLGLVSNLTMSARDLGVKSLQSEGESTEKTQFYTCFYGAMMCLPILMVTDGFSGFNTVDSNLLLSCTCFFFYNKLSLNVLEGVSNTITHSLINVCKRIVLILGSSLFFHNKMSRWGILGTFFVISGISLYRISNSFKHPRIILLATVIIGFAFSFLLASSLESQESVKTKLNTHSKDFDMKYDSDNRGVTWDGFMNGEKLNKWRGMRVDGCTAQLSKNREILEEEYGRVFKGFKYVAIINYPEHSNKGDSAIYSAEAFLLQNLGIETIYICADSDCLESNLRKRLKEYPKEEVVITLHGGGNFGDLYPYIHNIREDFIESFTDYKIVSFPQSVWYQNESNIEKSRQIFSKHPNLILSVRDFASLDFVETHFRRVVKEILMVPDVVFAFGAIHQMREWPVLQVVVLARGDKELGQDNTGKAKFSTIGGFVKTWSSSDWSDVEPEELKSYHLRGNHNDVDLWNQKAWMRTRYGMNFLSRGQLVISDRLHAHILSTLLGIPHIIMENTTYRKAQNVHEAWTSECDVKNGGSLVTTSNSIRDTIKLVGEWKNRGYKL